MKRKTVSVGKLLWQINFRLINSTKPEEATARQELHHFMTNILQSTDNYRGFGYLDMKHNGDGMYPTILDESRTFFYVDNNLKADYEAAEKHYRETDLVN